MPTTYVQKKYVQEGPTFSLFIVIFHLVIGWNTFSLSIPVPLMTSVQLQCSLNEWGAALFASASTFPLATVMVTMTVLLS